MASKERKIGRLLLMGGDEDPDESDMRLLPHLVKLAGGKRARILICSAPTTEPERKARVYRKLFEKIGVSEVYEAPISSRLEADGEPHLQAAERATGVFFTGGDQLRLTSVMAGTTFCETIRNRIYGEGLVVGGTSAGSSAIGSVMITSGQRAGTVRRADISLAPGLGYWRDTILDVHFNQRGRVPRLMTVLGQNPQILAIGIDTNTAIDVQPGREFTVLGEGAVTVFNGRVSHTNAADVTEEEVIALTDATLHILADGYTFNLESKRPCLPDGTELPKP